MKGYKPKVDDTKKAEDFYHYFEQCCRGEPPSPSSKKVLIEELAQEFCNVKIEAYQKGIKRDALFK